MISTLQLITLIMIEMFLLIRLTVYYFFMIGIQGLCLVVHFFSLVLCSTDCFLWCCHWTIDSASVMTVFIIRLYSTLGLMLYFILFCVL